MKTKIKIHEIRDEKKKFKESSESLKNRPISNPLFPPSFDNEISSPVSPNLSERNISIGPTSVSTNSKDAIEDNEKSGQIQISIKPTVPSDIHEPQSGSKCNCNENKNKKIKLPQDDPANHVKYESFDFLRLIGKGSFGQVFLVDPNYF